MQAANLFAESAVPLLEQVVAFTQKRHEVLAGNIANLDTPGYRAADLSPELFGQRLAEAIRDQDRRAARGAAGPAASPLAEVTRDVRGLLRHDDNNTSVEYQVTEMAKNQMQHNLALAIMASQFRLLAAAVSERA
jgi:flagellar basal-body rod protein FlgB